MFKHLLIPTDGSDLSRKAVLYGVQLAKECGAKVTALTLAEPYHVASMDAVLVSVGEDEYEEGSRRIAEQALEQVQDRGGRGGRALRHDPRSARSALSGHHRRGSRQGLRPHRDGLARTARHLGAAARQRDRQSPHPLDHSGPRLPLKSGRQSARSTRNSEPSSTATTLTLAPDGQSPPATRHELSPTRMRP